MAIVKFLGIGLLSLNIPDLTGLLAAYALAQFAMIIVSAIYIKKCEPQLRCKLDYLIVISFFRENMNSLKGYYLSAILKRVNDNSLPLIFSAYLTKSEIGLFTLLQKSLAMGVTFLRVFEAALFHRQTAKVIDEDLRKFIPLLLLTHLTVLVCGAAYIYFSIEILMYELVLISFLLYPLALTVTFRAKLFGQYNTLVINTAALLSLTAFIISVWVMKFMGLPGLMIAILSYSLLVIINAVVIYFGWKIINNEK